MENLILEDVAYYLMNFFSAQDLLNMSLVNKSWYELSNRDHVWNQRIRELERYKKNSAPYRIPNDITKELAIELESKFLKINRKKIFYFLYKNILTINCMIWNKQKMPCTIIEYYESSDEEAVFLNLKHKIFSSVGYVMYKKRNNNLNVVYTIYERKDQFIKCKQKYDQIYAISNDLFIGTFQTGKFNKVHVYQFNYEIQRFQRLHELVMENDQQLPIEYVLTNEQYLTILDSNFIWRWNLKSGINMYKVTWSKMVGRTDKIVKLHPVDDTKVLLEIDYDTKKFLQHKAFLLDFDHNKKLFEIKFNCPTSFMVLKVTKKYIILVKRSRSAKLGCGSSVVFAIYDINTGELEYLVDLDIEYVDYRGMFCLNSDILIISCIKNEVHTFFFCNVTTHTLEFKHDAGNIVFNDHKTIHFKLLPGPGSTVILCTIERDLHNDGADSVYVDASIIHWKNQSKQHTLPVEMPIVKRIALGPSGEFCFDDTFRSMCLYDIYPGYLNVKKYHIW